MSVYVLVREEATSGGSTSVATRHYDRLPREVALRYRRGLEKLTMKKLGDASTSCHNQIELGL